MWRNCDQKGNNGVTSKRKRSAAAPFWQRKTLDEMTREEWESLCDGCGRCCLNKIEWVDTGEISLTSVACKLLDIHECRCRNYEHRFAEVPDCIKIDPDKVATLTWLPETCAYRRVQEGRGLDWWHPLVSGNAETVHMAGISVRGWAKSERRIKARNFEKYIIADYPPEERGGGARSR